MRKKEKRKRKGGVGWSKRKEEEMTGKNRPKMKIEIFFLPEKFNER